MRRVLLLSTVALAACGGEDGAELTVSLEPNQVVVAVSTVDGRSRASLVRYQVGEPVRVESDDGKPIYTWVLDEEDYVDATGEFVTTDALARIVPRTSSEAPADSCDRCMVPTAKAPQIMNAGDACHPPSWNTGAVWRKDGEAYTCFGGPGSRVCPESNAEDAAIIEAVRRDLWLDVPGPCACVPSTNAPNSANMRTYAVTPNTAPWPMGAFSARDDGVVAGFSRHGGFVWDPATGVSNFTKWDDLDVTVKHSVALPSGDFLMSSEKYNTGFTTMYQYYRVPVANGTAGDPVALGTGEGAISERMMYVDADVDFPLYILGGAGVVGSIEPGAFACRTDPEVACQRVTLGRCDDEREFARARDMAMLPDGSAIVVAHKGLFYKTPNEPPLQNPHPSDTWRCAQYPDGIPRADGSGDVDIHEYRSIWTVGNRAYVCAVANAEERCMARRAAVLTATISTAFGESPEPDWEVVWESNPGIYCREFLPPRASGVARLSMSGHRLIDFDADGNVIEQLGLRDEYGSFDRMGEVYPIGGDVLLGYGGENQMYANTGSTSFAQIYGPDDLDGSALRAAVALPGGDFVVFGHGDGAVRVAVDGVTPTATVMPTERLSGIHIEVAVLDTAATTDAKPVVLLGGAKDSDSYLARAVVDGTTLSVGEALNIPPGFDDLEIVDVAETSPGRFVALTQGSRALKIVGDTVTEIEVDFDDPTTEDVESLPRLGPDQCSGRTPRTDVWRRVSGAGGVAWAIGRWGTVVRFVGDNTEAFAIPESLTMTSVRAECPDIMILGGKGNANEINGADTGHVWYTAAPIRLDPEDEEILVPRRETGLARIAKDELDTLTIGEVKYFTPIEVFFDATESGARAYQMALTNGYMYRMNGAERTEYVRAPFDPRKIVQNEDGVVLFTGAQNRIAIGVP